MVDMERDTTAARFGNLEFVDSATRPSVRSFFEQHYQRSLLLKGILVPSVAHENCLKLMLTGTTSDGSSDWPAILASAEASAYSLPQMVVAGPSFPGSLGGVVSRLGSSGQLPALMGGNITDWSDLPTGRPGVEAELALDAYMARRLEASASAGWKAALSGSYLAAHQQAQDLKELLRVIDWSSSSTLSDQIRLSVDALAQGVSRCASLSYSGYGWDTHVLNDYYQNLNFEGLFAGLLELMNALQKTPGSQGNSLADETVVVVLSEMGRTPQLNGSDGKDHWPYTSMLMVGPGITGNRVVGGYDDLYYGMLVDPESGELSESGEQLTSSALGATLLNLADIDHNDFLTGISALPGILS
jgi:hypothetical protein